MSEYDGLTLVPWRVLDEWQIGRRTIERLYRLQNHDLDCLTKNLIDKGPRFSPEQVWPLRDHFGHADYELAKTLETEFKRFVALSLLRPGEIYAPSGPVDMYWHFLVLHTREYDEFCANVWGRTTPNHGRPPEAPQESSNGLDSSPAAQGPISLLPDSVVRGLAPEVRSRLATLESWDLSSFTSGLADNRNRKFSPEQTWPIVAHFGHADGEVASMLETEFRKFIALTMVKPELTFAPSGPVDMYWHFLILHTREYRDFCDAVWGQFKHHPRGTHDDKASERQPMLDHGPLDHDEEDSAPFRTTVEQYASVFGEPDERVWVEPDYRISV